MVDFPLPLKVEAAFGANPSGDPADWTWTDLTDRAFKSESPGPILITRGRQDEQSEAQTSQMSGLVLDNPDGALTPGNPLSPWYPNVKRGTPIRTRLDGLGLAGLQLRHVEGLAQNSWAESPLHIALDTTDLDLRVDFTPQTWRPAADMILAARYRTDDERSWIVLLTAEGGLKVFWSPDGTLPSRVDVTSTATIPAETGRAAVRVTVDVDNGSGGHAVTFYTGPSVDGPWTVLGDPVVGGGTTALHPGLAALEVGSGNTGRAALTGSVTATAVVHRLRLCDPVGGALVVDGDFESQAPGTRTFVDDVGRTWEVLADAQITDPAVRAIGQIASIEPTWPFGDVETDHQAGEARASIVASGIMRRLGQGASVLRSSLYRGITGEDVTTPRAYWSCEDGASASVFASAFAGDPVLTPRGAVTPADWDDAPATAAIPTYGVGYAVGTVPAYPSTGYMRLMAMVNIPESLGGDRVIMSVVTAGTARSWSLSINGSGDLTIRATNSAGTNILTSAGGFDLLGQQGLIWIYLIQDGADVDWEIGFASTSGGAGVLTNTLSSRTFGRAVTVTVGALGGDLEGMAVGHVTVLSSDDFWNILPFVQAWSGELAVDRMRRLAAEEGIPLAVRWDGTSQRMGPQTQATFLDLVREAAAVDGGLLTESRDVLGLEYRAIGSLYNQPAALALDASGGHGDIVNPLAPVDDDQSIVNDYTASRREGSSARVVNQAHVDEHGRYDDSATLNVESDTQLASFAGWRVHLGTWAGMRFPSISPAINVKPELAELWMALNVGDRITCTGLPSQHPLDVDLLMQGYSESLSPKFWDATANTSPAGPWDTWVLEAATNSRADTDHSEVAAADATPFVSGTHTTLVVASGRFESFEQSALVVTPVAGGAAPWERDDSEAHAGAWSLRAGAIGDDQQSDAIVVVPDFATSMSFWYKVSSESGFDFFRFLIDGVQQIEQSGEVDWTFAEFPVVAGQTLTFRYIKDSSDAGGSDTAWIDELSFHAPPLWTVDDAQFPLYIETGGVVLEVTDITGGASPQTFTVTQEPLNGIAKTIPAGTPVMLADPAIVRL